AATQAPAASTAQPQQQSADAQPAVAQAPQTQSGHEPPGQAKKQQQSAPSTQSSSQTGPGVKPNSTTTHWTHCTTGKSTAGATCTSSDNGHTPQPNADASKRYGNDKTAPENADPRGGNDDPTNSNSK